ncbi:MAG: hypothetical protein WBN04_04845 [Paracoccaceae bacterium]
MTPDQVQALFTRSDGSYQFARWGRPIVPVVFGVEDNTLAVVKGAIEAVVALAGHKMAETDPELGANLMLFFLRDWGELSEVPNLDRLLPELPGLVARLQDARANQYRLFRFDDQGAIQACFVFLRMDAAMREQPADILALGQIVQAVLAWGDRAFTELSPLARLPDNGATILKPEIAAVVRASYDPSMPVAAQDSSHALRLYARMQTET